MKAYKGVLYVGTQSGNVYSLDSTTLSAKATLFYCQKQEPNAVYSLGVNEKYVVISRSRGTALVRDRKSKKHISALENAETIDEIFHLRNNRFCWGNAKKEVFVRDLTVEKPECRLLPATAKDTKAGVSIFMGRHLFAHFGNLLFTLNSNALRVYDLKTRAHLQTIKIEGRKEMRIADGKLFVLSQTTGENSQLHTYKFTPSPAKK